MTRMTGPDCAVVCNLINTHTHTVTGPDCAVMCNLTNTHTHNTKCMFVCMYGHTYSKSMNQPGKVANNPDRGQLSRENEHFPVPVRA